VIETSLQIDPMESLRDGERKAVLRKALGRFVPAEAIPTAKRGFAVPLGDWLKGPLRPVVEESLLGPSSQLVPWFERRGLREYWDDHLAGRRDCKWGLWTLLSLQWWLEGAASERKICPSNYKVCGTPAQGAGRG
jgi:asparagine synthase (glutamine-hydrolysing)